MNEINLSDLVRKSAYYQFDGPDWTKKLWTRFESFSYFIKAHRDHLVQKGAIRRIGREYFIDLNRFPAEAEVLLGVRQEGGAQ